MNPENSQPTLEDLADDFFSVLNSDRPKFVNKLWKNYTYDHLRSILAIRSYKRVDTLSLNETTDMDRAPYMQETEYGKYIYRSMSGLYHNKRYQYSSIDWLPTKEFIDGLVALITKYGIRTVEETNASLAILTSLLRKTLKDSNLDVVVTCSDPMTSQSTSIQLDYANIARRSIGDFRYYRELEAEIPEMIVHTFPLRHGTDIVEKLSLDIEIIEFIRSATAKIVITIVPFTSQHVHKLLYEASKNSSYRIAVHYIKAFSKYFDVTSIVDNFPVDTMAYFFVRDDIASDLGDLSESLENAILPRDTMCPFIDAKTVYNVFPHTSFRVIQDIYEDPNRDLIKKFTNVKRLQASMKLCRREDITIPHFIHTCSDVRAWISLVSQRIYLWFETRKQYTDFNSLLSVQNETPEKIATPSWMKPRARGFIIWWVYMVATKLDTVYMFNASISKNALISVIEIVSKNNLEKIREFM